MNIQGIVRVGSMDYDVILTDEKIINQDGEECLGITDHNLHEIKISTRLQNEQGQEKTFLHELIHAMIAERNLDFECITEEILAEDLSSILYQVIRDNREMFTKSIETTTVKTWVNGNCLVQPSIGQKSKAENINLNKSSRVCGDSTRIGIAPIGSFVKNAIDRVTKEQYEDSIKLFKGKNINELSKIDVPDLAKILSSILRREYNPHTQLIIDSVSFRIADDIFGATFND